MSSLWPDHPSLPGLAHGEFPPADYYLEEGPPDYGRAIGGNILTPLRRVV